MLKIGSLRAIFPLLLAICGAVNVKTILFKNSNPRTANVIFSDPIIVENIFLSKKVNNDTSVDVEALSNKIIKPSDYMEKVKNAGTVDDPKSAYYRDATIGECTIDLSDIKFLEDTIYGFKVQLFKNGGELYSETFVYSDGKLMYTQERKNRSWYMNIWVWCTLLSMIVIFLVVARICVRRK
ncbi:hypothetical protein PAEPH01_0827 [Pancytospora epiphaga]|nr:hypothetical protein PAEPH01_0827 [Pancytospora epiphaga]